MTIKLEKHEIIPIHKKSLITVFFGTFGGISFLIHNFYTNFNARLYFLNIKKKSNQLRQYNNWFDDKLNKVIVLSVLESILLDNSKIKNQTIEYPNILKNEKYVFINNSQENNCIIINKSGGFFHFYIEVIPILLRLKNYNIYFVIENKDFYHSVLKFYNINYFDVDLENIGKIESFKMDKYYPSSKYISWFKSYNDKIKVIRTAPKKIYITRRNERARRISNENELFYYLSKMGYELIDPGKLNFNDQVIYFKNAEYIVSAHGAALSNIIWCKSSVKIIELNGSQDVRWHFAKMANTLNLNYTLLIGKTIDNVYFEVNIDSLIKVLEDNY